MALFENLPVYQVSYDLLRDIYRLCINMERTYRFTLGERIQKEMTDLLLNIYRANSTRDKSVFLSAARENAIVVRLLLRVAHDEKQISRKSFIMVNDKIESASKQLTAWGKSVNTNIQQQDK
jgi:four helix bundle protein